MRFWDASAIVPLFVTEATTPQMRTLREEDRSQSVWWGTILECRSALERRVREGASDVADSRTVLLGLQADWSEIAPTTRMRSVAERMLASHPLRAADALQLAAALEWSESEPVGYAFVCLDDRLRDAAAREGFAVLP